VDPRDPEAIAGAIRMLLTDRTLREDLRRRGLVRARAFSWEQSVARTRAIYAEVLGR
jgi:glycosyltransferase involved in cell wall biosynthesis